MEVQTVSVLSNIQDMKRKQNRRDSFNNFPINNIEELVDNGFYYHGTFRLKCEYCGLIIDTLSGEPVIQKHKELMPNCLINRILKNTTMLSEMYSNILQSNILLLNNLNNTALSESSDDELDDISSSESSSEDDTQHTNNKVAINKLNIDDNTLIPIDNISDIQNILITEDIQENQKCIICLKNKKDILFLPCKHLQTCLSCTKEIKNKKCCVCREPITHIIQVYN